MAFPFLIGGASVGVIVNGDVISSWFGQFLAKWVIYWVPSLCNFLSGKQKHFLFRRNDFSKPIFPTVEIFEIFYKDRENSNQLATEFSVGDFSIRKRKVR